MWQQDKKQARLEVKTYARLNLGRAYIVHKVAQRKAFLSTMEEQNCVGLATRSEHWNPKTGKRVSLNIEKLKLHHNGKQ